MRLKLYFSINEIYHSKICLNLHRPPCTFPYLMQKPQPIRDWYLEVGISSIKIYSPDLDCLLDFYYFVCMDHGYSTAMRFLLPIIAPDNHKNF